PPGRAPGSRSAARYHLTLIGALGVPLGGSLGGEQMGADVVTLGATFVPLIDQMDASSPQNIAVSGQDGTLTYAELSARAEQVAQRLRQAGVKPGDLVGLCLHRS